MRRHEWSAPLTFEVDDTFKDGITDITEVFINGYPVEEDPGGGWRRASENPTLVVGRTVRTHSP